MGASMCNFWSASADNDLGINMTHRTPKFAVANAFRSSIILPERQTLLSVGYDCFMPSRGKMDPGAISLIPLGIKVTPPSGFYAQLFLRSSWAMKGLIIQGGVIDPDYEGEVKAVLFNFGLQQVKWEKDDRIVQIVFIAHNVINGMHDDESIITGGSSRFNIRIRGDGGFGSTTN